MLPHMPILSARQTLAKARLEIEVPSVPDRRSFRCGSIRPNTSCRSRTSSPEITIPGLEAPPLQFVRGGTENSRVEVLRRHHRHARGRADRLCRQALRA